MFRSTVKDILHSKHFWDMSHSYLGGSDIFLFPTVEIIGSYI